MRDRIVEPADNDSDELVSGLFGELEPPPIAGNGSGDLVRIVGPKSRLHTGNQSRVWVE